MNHLVRFPRSHRYGLGERIEERLYAVLEGLTEARYATGPQREQRLRPVPIVPAPRP